MQTPKKDDNAVSGSLWLLVVLAAMGGFLDSYDLISVGAATFIAKSFHQLVVTPSDIALANSAAFVGAILASLLAGRYSDAAGRRVLFVLDLLLFVVVAPLQALVSNVQELIFLRLLIGVAIGIDLPVAWTLICETAPTGKRGRLVSMMFTFWALGGLVSFLVALALLPLGAIAWRLLLASGAVPAIIVLVLRRGVPESPRWLQAQGRHEEAARAASSLGLSAQPEAQPPRSGGGDLGYVALFTRYWRLALFEGTFMFVFAATGLLLSIYPAQIFAKLGLTGFHNSLYVGALSWVLILLGMITCALIVDKVGRRPLSYLGSLGAALLLWLLSRTSPSDFPLFLGAFCAFAYVSVLGAWGPAWVYQSEIFPTRLRATGAGYAGAMNRIGAAVAAFGVPMFLAGFGFQRLLDVFIVANLVLFVVLLSFGFETRGMSLEQIEDMVESRNPAAG